METSENMSFLSKWTSSFPKFNYFRIAEKFPRLNFAFSLFIAAIGFFVLLIFPYLLLTLPSDLYNTVVHADKLKDWIDSVIILVLLALSGAFCWALFKLKFSVPTGIDVTEEKFPNLIKLISELKDEFGKPRIDHIILRDKFEIRVIKTPRSGMPFMLKHTLIIGLPTLLSMSPLYFRALLARRIGQLSNKHTPVTTRLYFLTDIWSQFKVSCLHSKNKISKALGYFFRFYSPLYKTCLIPLVQKEELEADSYGMDLVNDRDMVECIVYEEVVTTFLKNKFWPKIFHMAKRSKTPEFMPYSQMTKVVKAGINNDEVSQTIQHALSKENGSSKEMPTLAKRLNHLGHVKPLPPKRLSDTAADFYLGSNQEKIIQLFDKRWLGKIKAKI